MFRTRACSVLVACMSCAPKAESPPPVVAHEVAATPAVSSNEATPTPTRKSGGPRHVMPNGLVHVTLVGFDDVPAVDSDLPSARARHAAVEEKYEATYRDPGHEAWFFHAFDSSSLEFVIARWEPSPRVGGKYVAVQRIRVERTPKAVSAFHLETILEDYERGHEGVKGGMSPSEVESIRGKPERVQELGPFGAFDYVYPDACIRFLSGRVAEINDRTSCVRE